MDILQDAIDAIDDTTYTCPTCGSTCLKSHLARQYVKTEPSSWATLAGREGYEYSCRKCGAIVTTDYLIIS